MTDLIDDDIIEINKPTTSAAVRRPMFIETEVRTDTITKRRVGSTTSTTSRSVYDILQNTKSPTDGLPPTTYTYAHSVSYMPVTQNGSYDVPVMARRDLHGYGSSSFSSGSHSVFSSPTRFISNVKSQLANGYSAIRDRLTHHNDQQQSPAPLINSSFTQGGGRYSRSSSQSSTNAQTGNYNLRQRQPPVHSTPRDTDTEHRKISSKQRKDRQSQDENGEEEKEDEEKNEKDEDNIIVRFIKNVLHAPTNFLSFIFRKFFGLPWWLLIPLILFLGFYAFPHLVCKPFEHYPESKIYQNCRNFQQYTTSVMDNSTAYLRDKTFSPGINYFKRFFNSVVDLKNYLLDKFDDVYSYTKKQIYEGIESVKRFIGVKKVDAQTYCEESLKKATDLYDELKNETGKLLAGGSTLNPNQQSDLRALIQKLLENYGADETGKADYALEANGGKIVDTRCTEYTDEPRQNVVKFLGIPIVHMSKQPNIMIKAGRMPGQCFPFKGDQGSVIIKLAVPVKPTEFVVEHLPKHISIVGHINSAPKNFTVYALKDKNDKEGTVLGRFYYDAESGKPLQQFIPQPQHVPIVEYIELRVTSNWGNPNYTCLYRFRVHGDLQTVQPSAPPAA